LLGLAGYLVGSGINRSTCKLAWISRDVKKKEEKKEKKIGKAIFQELAVLRKPVIDINKILHWPLLFLFVEVMSTLH